MYINTNTLTCKQHNIHTYMHTYAERHIIIMIIYRETIDNVGGRESERARERVVCMGLTRIHFYNYIPPKKYATQHNIHALFNIYSHHYHMCVYTHLSTAHHITPHYTYRINEANFKKYESEALKVKQLVQSSL